MASLAAFGQNGVAAHDTTQDSSSDQFYLWYNVAGLGSNLGRFLPVVRIKDGVLFYSYQQNSYMVTKDPRIDTICLKQIRKSSIDSILQLTKGMMDTTIFRMNSCIISGVVHFMTVAQGSDTLFFKLHNTFDYTELKIVDILNTYFPAEKKLWANEQMIRNAKDCDDEKEKQWNEKKRGSVKKATNNR